MVASRRPLVGGSYIIRYGAAPHKEQLTERRVPPIFHEVCGVRLVRTQNMGNQKTSRAILRNNRRLAQKRLQLTLVWLPACSAWLER